MWFDPQDAVDRLDAEVSGFALIGTARDLGAAQIETIRTPSAWIVVLSETAGEVRYEFGDFIEQLVTVRFAVILAVRDLGDRTGARAGADLHGIRKSVHRAISAWKPSDANHACRFARGSLVSGIGRDGTLFWQDEFTVSYDRRTTPEATP